MPTWVTIILSAAAVTTALGVLWQKVFLPAIRAASVAEEMLPLLREMTREFGGKSHTFAILEQIIAQFRTDSGSSMRDLLNRLEAAVEDNKIMDQVLSIKVAAVKEITAEDRALAVQDRATMAVLAKDVERLIQKMDLNTAATDRIEHVVTPDPT